MQDNDNTQINAGNDSNVPTPPPLPKSVKPAEPNPPAIPSIISAKSGGASYAPPKFVMPGASLGNGRLLPYVRNSALGLVTLFGTAFIMLILMGLIFAIFMKDGIDDKFLRIVSVIQDILVFIVPAILAAFVATRLPANLLTVNVKPRLPLMLLAIATVVVSMPALNLIIALNESIPFPDWVTSMEEDAAESVQTLAGGSSIGDLVMGILIIGILTGISEELFFRGAMQNLFRSTRLNGHICIWLVAIIFSAAHFQFYGFIPRMLLGAFFGYLLWWSGSVWVAVCAHAFNNAFYVVVQWIVARSGVNIEEMAQSATDASDLTSTAPEEMVGILIAAGFSLTLTIFLLYFLRKEALRLASARPNK